MTDKSPITIKPEVLNELVSGLKNQKDIDALIREINRRSMEKILEAELDHHLGYEKHEPKGKNSGNSRNGYTKKTVKSDLGQLEIKNPRDRQGSFEPQIIKKRQTRVKGVSDKIMALYAKGMTTRDIQDTLEEMYGAELSHSLISKVTDAVIEEVQAFQKRPLESVYPILYLDAIHVKVHQEHEVISKAIYLALGVNMEGQKELLGLWIEENEGSKFWLNILTELKNRGLNDLFIACVDGLTGFPDAIKAVYPKAQIQLCIVHMVRNSMKYVTYKDRKKLAQDLKAIYRAINLKDAEKALQEFQKNWDSKYPSIGQLWSRHWENIIPFFNYPKEIRKVIYTTNAIESLNMTIRKAIKNRRIFPNDTSALKIVYLAIKNASKRWTMPIRDWKPALNRFAITFQDRCPL